MMKKVRKAVFPVGGLGTRFLPATKSMPKEMLPIANKPLIQHAFEEALEAGIEEFIFITGRNKNAINNHFDHVFELEHFLGSKEKQEALAQTRDWLPEPGNVIFIRQQKPLGLGHAVWCARNLIQDEPFAIILADELFISESGNGLLKEMVEAHAEVGGNLLAVAEVPQKDVSKYGIVKPEVKISPKCFKISDMVEKPTPQEAPSNFSITGRYILDSSIFNYLENSEAGSGGEIQLTDAMRRMLEDEAFYGYTFSGKRLDCGSHIGFFEANIEFALVNDALREQAKDIIRKIAAREE